MRYKEFLIESYSWSQEIKEWDGHRNEGTGRYNSGTHYKIIHPRTGKRLEGFKLELDAKRYIDKWLNKAAAKKRLSVLKKRNFIDMKVQKHKNAISLLERKSVELSHQLPPKDWF